METGKVEYAPDYKSKRRMGQPFKEFLAEQMRDPEFAKAFKAADVEVEHARLKDAVVEAAKADRVAESAGNGGNPDIDALITSRARFRLAVDALIAFEAENGLAAMERKK
jgi:hypothetical protein